MFITLIRVTDRCVADFECQKNKEIKPQSMRDEGRGIKGGSRILFYKKTKKKVNKKPQVVNFSGRVLVSGANYSRVKDHR